MIPVTDVLKFENLFGNLMINFFSSQFFYIQVTYDVIKFRNFKFLLVEKSDTIHISRGE